MSSPGEFPGFPLTLSSREAAYRRARARRAPPPSSYRPEPTPPVGVNRRLILDTYPPLTPLECIGSELRPLDSADRLRNVVILGVMLSAEALVGLALFATGFWSALPWRVLAGTGLAGCYMPCLKVFTDRLPQARHARAVSSRTRRFRLFHWHRLIGRGRLSEKHAGDFLTLLRR